MTEMRATPDQTIEEHEYAAVSNLRDALEVERRAKGTHKMVSPDDPEYKTKVATARAYRIAQHALTTRLQELEDQGHIRSTYHSE